MTNTPPTPPARRPLHRLVLLGSVCALALATCAPALTAGPTGEPRHDSEGGVLGTRSEAAEVTTIGDVQPVDIPDLPDNTRPLTRSHVRPAPIQGGQEALQDATATSEELEAEELEFEDVTVQRPSVVLSGERLPGIDAVQAALEVEGVRFATSLRIASIPLDLGDGDADGDLQVAVVEPRGFRLLTPQVTADAIDVWRRIVEGDAAFTHDVGYRLQTEHEIELGGRVPLRDSDETLRIGAYASNGIPPVAEAVVSRSTASELGIEGEPTLLVALDEDVSPDAVLGALEEATGMAGEVIPEPTSRRAFLTGAASRDAFEPFTYVSMGDGMIQIDQDWVRRNIVRARVPIFRGEVVCHRLLIPQLRGALQEVVERDLAHLIDPSQYGGCWVPRHILFNPNRGLSMHAWGLAVDFNVKGNEYGNYNPEMDPRIVEIFERWGFVWGGHWSTPDGMHFELGALLQNDG